MNTFFAIAGALSLFNTGLHFYVGGKEIARPLLDAKMLPDSVRSVQYFCWHITTLSLFLLAVLFGVPAVDSNSANLAVIGTALAGGIAIIGIIIPLSLRVGYRTMPQGWLFVPVTALGLMGLFA